MQRLRHFACCLGVLVLCLLPGAQGQDTPHPSPAADQGPSLTHISKPVCSVVASKDYTTYGLYYHVLYTDKPPYDAFIEGNTPDYVALYDQCGAFLEAMEMAQIKEAVLNGKAEMKRRREEHYFLDAKKYAKK